MTVGHFEFEAIGTHWIIDIYDPVLVIEKQSLLQTEIAQRIADFDAAYSRFRSDSLVSHMATAAGSYDFPSDASPLLTLYQKLYEITEGKFTPLIGKTLEQAGYDATYSLQQTAELAAPPQWENTMTVSGSKVIMLQPAMLDFGAAGKGYLADIIAEIIQAQGVTSFVVDAGGDIVHRSTEAKHLEIGLENPFESTQVIGVARISNQSLCGSAGNRRAWGGFTHIIDPQTLQSPKDIAALWVVAKTGLLADGLTTALFFTEPKKLIAHFSFEYLILYRDSSVAQSEHFPAELFYSK